jgi:hypothetical protein
VKFQDKQYDKEAEGLKSISRQVQEAECRMVFGLFF